MAETDDIVARLHNAERAYASETWVPIHNADARRLFIEAATALTERDAQIKRLEKGIFHLEKEEMQATLRATTAERERDEARAEVGRLRELLASAWDMLPALHYNSTIKQAKYDEISAALTKGGAALPDTTGKEE